MALAATVGLKSSALAQAAECAPGVGVGIEAAMKAQWGESDGMRRFQESVMAPAADALASATLRDLEMLAGSSMMADASLTGDSLLRLDESAVARLAETGRIIPPGELLFAGDAWRGELSGPLSRLPVDPPLELTPTPERLLVGDWHYQAHYPPVRNAPLVETDSAPGAPDGVLVDELRVAGGSPAQIGNLLEHFFGQTQSSERCFVARERDEDYWTIYHAEDTGSEARQPARGADGIVGFIGVVDLPVAIVQVFGAAERDRPQVIAFVKRLKQMIEANGFKLNVVGQKIKREPPGGVLERVKSVCELREERKGYGVVRITRTAACQLQGIDQRTFKKYEPEIYERWEDSEL